LPLTVESEIDGYPVKVPMIDIHTVGAGGGSIAYKDEGGALRVGPISAGADPGPICYGKGEQITVTDANLYLGRLIPEHFLGGNMKLVKNRLDSYFSQLAREFSISEVELAEGILQVANTNMERAIRVISVERGYNPSEFTLFSFGGAGGMHAPFLAKYLNIPRVFVPKNPGILSAIGMLLSDIIKDYSKTVMLKKTPGAESLKSFFSDLEKQGIKDLLNEGVEEENITLELYLDMRYIGQSYEIIVPFSRNYVDTFHEYHKRLYGYANYKKPVEIVNLRLRARGKMKRPQFERKTQKIERLSEKSYLGDTDVIFDGKKSMAKVLNRDFLQYGNKFDGPAIIVEYSSTIVVPPSASVEVDPFENLIIHV